MASAKTRIRRRAAQAARNSGALTSENVLGRAARAGAAALNSRAGAAAARILSGPAMTTALATKQFVDDTGLKNTKPAKAAQQKVSDTAAKVTGLAAKQRREMNPPGSAGDVLGTKNTGPRVHRAPIKPMVPRTR